MPDDVDLSARISDTVVVAPVRFAEMVKGIVGRDAPGARHDGPYTKDNVEKQVMPFPNNPKPEYPWRLRTEGVEGSFVVVFVVDSTGRVDERSLQFPQDARTLFVDSVRRALRRSRYNPAEVGGQRVTQVVEQRFTFVLER